MYLDWFRVKPFYSNLTEYPDNKFSKFFSRRFGLVPLVLLQKEEIESEGRLIALETVLYCALGEWTAMQPIKYVPRLNRSARPSLAVPNPSDVAFPDAGVFVSFHHPGMLTITVLDDQVAGMNIPLDVSLSAVNISARTLETPTMGQQRLLHACNQL